MVEVSPYCADIARACDGLAGLPPTPALPGSRRENILVTGATGLIGGCLVDMLLKMPGWEGVVWAMGRSAQRGRRRFARYWDSGRFHFLEGDVTQPLPVDVPFDYIVHAASGASPKAFQETPVEVMLSNLLGVRQLMEYGLGHGMRRLLYVSSGEVYGEGNGTPFREADSGYVDPTSPRACYPSSKRAAETLCVSYAAEYHADVVIARPCHVYGPYFAEADNRAYAQFLRNVLRGEDIVMKSPGLQYRSWLYVVDCAHALLQILFKGERGTAYNVADEASCITIRELAETVARHGGCRVVMDIDPLNGNTTPVTKATFCTDRLRALGWQPLWSIDEALRHTVGEMKRNEGNERNERDERNERNEGK